jgi:hypothetical protein
VNLRPLVIAGMHRSGTSYVASVLRAGGLQIGERLLGPNAANVRGHFEDLDFTELHERMLGALGAPASGWTATNRAAVEASFDPEALGLIHARAHHPAWGWKDPRSTLFLDFWSGLLPDACFVLVYRKPWEIVDSLFRRGDRDVADDPLLPVRAWLEHNERVLRFRAARPQHALLVNVEAVADASGALVRLIGERFGIPVREPDVDPFEPAMMRLTGAGCFEEQMTRMCFPQASRLYNRLEADADLPAGERVREDPIDPTALAMPLFLQWFGLRALEGNARMLRLRADFAAQFTPAHR